MGRLDRYIARQFITNVIALFVILACFVVAIDVSLNIDRFVKIATQMGEVDGVAPGAIRRAVLTALLIVDLWGPRLLQLFNFLSGMVMIGAMGFTCTRLIRHREVLAMLAAGVSLRRVLRPILIVGLGMTALQIANQELVMPRIAPLVVREHNDAGRTTLGATRVPMTADGAGRLLRAHEFDAELGKLFNVFVIERHEDGRPARAIRADSATWNAEGGFWTLENGYAESRDTAGLGREPVEKLVSALDPTRLTLAGSATYRHCLSFRQVGSMLEREDLLDRDMRDELSRIQYGRFSVAAVNLLALVVSSTFFLSRVPIGIIGRTLRCAPVAIISLVGGVVGSSATIPGVPAELGVFLPVMALLPITLAAVATMKT